MENVYDEILRTLCRPLEPIPSGQSPVLQRLSDVRAVMFDVYGTLFVSDSGDVGTAPEAACREALEGAMQSLGQNRDGQAAEGVRCLLRAIEASHARSRRLGIDFPEVDIVDIWREVVRELAAKGLMEESAWPDQQLRRLAIEYEGRSNPVWPMPGVRECLASLCRRGLTLGIISNAQFYTPRLFSALLGGAAESLGFDPTLEYYSYRYGHAKPGLAMHQMAARDLSRRGIEPRAVLYVGNDMLNDVCPAAQVGFRTALFAGDAHSLRLHQGDPRLASFFETGKQPGPTPDLVLTELAQLERCV